MGSFDIISVMSNWRLQLGHAAEGRFGKSVLALPDLPAKAPVTSFGPCGGFDRYAAERQCQVGAWWGLPAGTLGGTLAVAARVRIRSYQRSCSLR